MTFDILDLSMIPTIIYRNAEDVAIRFFRTPILRSALECRLACHVFPGKREHDHTKIIVKSVYKISVYFGLVVSRRMLKYQSMYYLLRNIFMHYF